MKVDKIKLENVKNHGKYGRIIACAIYLYHKDPQGAGTFDITVHAQVADLILKGHNSLSIAKKTGFDERSVRNAIRDIQNYVGAKD